MRTIDESILAILKGRKQIGSNKPAYSITIEAAPTGDLDILSDTEVEIYKLGYNNIDETSQSNFVETTDGRYMCVWINESLQLEVGYTAEKTFLTQDYAVTGINTYAGITVGVRGNGCTALHRRDDGSILVFVNDLSTAVNPTLKCYLSANGTGSDIAYYSTVYTAPRSGDINGNGYNVNPPLKLSSARLVLTAAQSGRPTAANCGLALISISDDNGATWTTAYTASGLWNKVSYVSSCVQISDGTLYTIRTDETCDPILIKSINNGSTWADIGNIDDNNWNSDLFYSVGSDTLYNFQPRVNSFYKIVSPTQALVESLRTSRELVSTKLTVAQATAGTSAGGAGKMYKLQDGTVILQYANPLSDGECTGEHRIAGIPAKTYNLQAKNISISKAKGASSTASISIDNKDGLLSFGNYESKWVNALKPNNNIYIDQGYGENTIRTFTGRIDSVSFESFPSAVTVQARDNLKLALDQTITRYDKHVFTYPNCTIESIVLELCVLCGLSTDNVEATGITLEEFTFNYETYADAFQKLADLASFEWGCDEDGKFYFKRDYQGNNTDIAYTFGAGEDLMKLKIDLDDNDLFYKVDCYGKSGDTVLLAQAYFPNPSLYKISTQRIMKIDAPEASTLAACQEIANRAVYMMQGRVRKISFDAIAVPWLQCGDYIQIVEHDTYIDGIYRVADISLKQDAGGFTMSVTANYYGGAFIYPADAGTATQTANPSLNLIPQMTANDAPSGVAKASSIYQSIYQPWQAFNDTSEDYYWNAITNKGWISYEFEEKTIIDKYTLKARQLESYNLAMPKDWIFEALAADGTWVTLDTQTNQTAWGASEERTFLFANTTPYIRYCLTVSTNNGYVRLQLEQLKMFYGGGS